MKEILRDEEKRILGTIGTGAKSLRAFLNASTGRDRALLRAGMWLKAIETLPEVSEPGLSNSTASAKFLRPFFTDIKGQEEIWVLLLDNKNHPLEAVNVTAESKPSGASIDFRHLVKSCILSGCSGIIMAHNHPSGEQSASHADMRMTKDMTVMLSQIGVEVIDHLIITATAHSRIGTQF